MKQLTDRLSNATTNLTWATVLPALSAGAVIGVLLIFIEISFAAMIFSGSLAPFIAQGIGLMLFGLAFYIL
jgi:SulP family sulfate permease